ncbi:MAG: acetyl-CoA carboxylase biotin carboxyl carrier protein [Pseudomonadota bacterium]
MTTEKKSDKNSFNADIIRQLAEILDDTKLTEIEVEDGGLRVRVARQGMPVQQISVPVAAAPVAPAAVAPAAANVNNEVSKDAVTSPMVGTAYLASAPGKPNFIEIGATVKQGQTLLTIEAMKTFNEIPSPRSGKITQILIENGQPVEFGQPLVVIAA